MTGLIQVPAVPQTSSIAVAAPRTLTPDQIADLIGPWLRRIQLFTSNATAVKEGTIKSGHWGIPLSPSTIIDLGPTVDVVLLASRDRAMQYDGETMLSATDRNSDVYKKIKEMSETDKDSGAMYGTEFLAWVGPQQLFCTLFLGSPSARREALGFMSLLNQPAEVYSKLVGQRRKWEIPLIRKTEAFPFDLPTDAQVVKAWEQFTKPDDDDKEVVADAVADANSRER